MKINHKILSIPPYISTSWKNVLSLQVSARDGQNSLIINLVNGTIIEVPNLPSPVLDAIFDTHEKFLEQDNSSNRPANSNQPAIPQQRRSLPDDSALISIPLSGNPFEGIEGINGPLQHNMQAAHSPDLPKEMLEKISLLCKAMKLENSDAFPKPEPHCNCFHCQIMRAIHSDKDKEPDETQDEIDEPITEEDLRFRDWEIEKKADSLYLVKNPLNSAEQYNVFLGTPVGCTCGEKNCEHIKAVLNS